MIHVSGKQSITALVSCHTGTTKAIHAIRMTQTPTHVIIIGTKALPIPRMAPDNISVQTYVK